MSIIYNVIKKNYINLIIPFFVVILLISCTLTSGPEGNDNNFNHQEPDTIIGENEVVNVDFSVNEGTVTFRCSGYHHGIGPQLPHDDWVIPVKPQLVRTYDSDVFERGAQLGFTIHYQCTDKNALLNALNGDWTDWDNRITSRASDASGHEHVKLCIYNEPYEHFFAGYNNYLWSDYFPVWERAYQTSRNIDSTVKIVGPSISGDAAPGTGKMRSFLTYCRQNDCVPDVISWHNGDYKKLKDEIDEVYSIIQDLNLNPDGISVNEYACRGDGMPRPCPPGAFARYCAILEEADVLSSALANHENDNLSCALTEDYPQEPRSLWWALYSYAHITGNLVDLTSSSSLQYGDLNEGFDGIAGWDDSENKGRILVGCGKKGFDTLKVYLENLPFTQGELIHLKANHIYNTGDDIMSEQLVVIDTNFAFNSEDIMLNLTDFNIYVAFDIVIQSASR